MFGEGEEGEDTFKKGSILQMYNRNKLKKKVTHHGDIPLLLYIRSNYR